MRDATGFFAELSRPEFDDLVRSLERDRPRKPFRDVKIYKAHAYTLRLRGEQR